jgi:methylated-DNA-[protein]-cysteine S-methyltransferase
MTDLTHAIHTPTDDTLTDDTLTDPVERALRDYRPALRPPVLDGGDVVYVIDDTPLGRMLFAAHPDGRLLASRYAPDDASADGLLERLAAAVSPRVLRGGRVLDAVRHQLDDYLAGRRRGFDVAVDPVLATPFQARVLDRLAADVRYGTTTSYGALAAALGRPTASRAVGAALGANPLCVLLPCHRVVAASGALTGYAGGLAAKRLLLELEAGTARG